MKVYLWGGLSSGEFMDVPDHILEIEVRKPNDCIYPTLESAAQAANEQPAPDRYVKYSTAKIRGEDVIVFKHDKFTVRL